MIFKTKYLIGVSAGALLLLFDILYLSHERWFYALIVLSAGIASLQFWYDFAKENKRQKAIENQFLEFVNVLVGTVRAGISIPQAVIQVSDKEYGALTPHVKKLANQLEWGIPVHDALLTFSRDTNNKVIKRSIAIVIEAERSGGNIEDVLVSVTKSILDIKKLKEERRASTHSQIVQGYIVFFVFIGIMLLLQLKFFPALGDVISTGLTGFGSVIGDVGERANLDKVFLVLVLIQGFFAGLMIGKFSEGALKDGLLHSLILVGIAALLITTIKGGL